METKIVRIGNTLAVEIPEEIAVQASIRAGETVELVASGPGHLTVVGTSASPAAKKPADMTLKELLDGLGEGESLGEYDWGSPRGVEVW